MAKFAASGVLIGIIIIFGIIKTNESVGNALGTRLAATLAAENMMMRQQLIQISPRVSKLELRAGHLSEDAEILHMRLPRQKISEDTVSSFANAINGLKYRSYISTVKNIRP